MDHRPPQPGPEQARERQLQVRRARWAAVGSLVAVAALAAVIVLSATRGSGSHAPTKAPSTTTKSGSLTVPILAYHVINEPPPQSSLPPALYVPATEFTAQMQALKAGGWHAVTLDQLDAYWARKTPLGTGKPIVISFDNGYASQYTNALPVLKQLGWVGVENLQATGLPPSEGGLTDAQVRGLIGAGWELDSEGVSQPNLTTLDAGQLSTEVAGSRQTLRSRYMVPVNWFCYPAGRYNPTVVAAVRAAGYRGATTTASGWASPQSDPFRLPRLQVVGGTSPSQLLSQIMAASQTTSVPTVSNGT
jgi:peptidoglycan/xylan/chitin deacetylase (PgdA/CDA1 family)